MRSVRSIEAYKAQSVMKRLTETSRPGPTIRELLRKPVESMDAFERYAANVLREAGAWELTEEGKPALRAIRSAGGQLVRLSLPAIPAIHGDDNGAVRALEDAMNRLVGIACALSTGIGAHEGVSRSHERTRRQQLFERHGVEYPLWSDTERGSHVRLPQLATGNSPTFEYFNEIDWRMLDTVANNAHVFFQAAILANLNQAIFGVKAPHCSEWDVRTRLASILGGLEPPLRFAYKFDCDTGRNSAAVHFTVPSEQSFPSIISSGPTQQHAGDSTGATPPRLRNQRSAGAECEHFGERSNDVATQVHRPIAGGADGLSKAPSPFCARIVYALRMTALVAAACFGSGRVIDRAFIAGKDESGRALVSCTFARSQFVHATLALIDSGSFAAPDLRFDPDGVMQALSAEKAECAHDGWFPLGACQLEGLRFNPWEDERDLPDDMQRLFHAKRACDIDASHYLGGSADVIDEAKSDSTDSIVAAIAQLEHVAAELERKLEPPQDQPDSRPLYCEHALARAAVALLDDELNVASEAEAFLGAELGNDVGKLPDVHYYRAPDALYHAHVGLADLYRKLGDVRGAEEQADRCIALAPTTPVGYAMKADALAGQGRYKEAANVLMAGLHAAIVENDQALLLFDLAQLFRRVGRTRESSALHIYTASLSGIYAKKSLEFVRQLANGENVHEFMRAHAQEAAQVMHATGIPLVPERVSKRLVAQAALGLANARMPRTAAPYVAELAKHFPTNRTVTDACNSICYGIS